MWSSLACRSEEGAPQVSCRSVLRSEVLLSRRETARSAFPRAFAHHTEPEARADCHRRIESQRMSHLPCGSASANLLVTLNS